jgi:hypothetical protein
MSLDASLDASVTDDGVAFELTVTNTGSNPADLSFPNALKADFAVIENGSETWRFSDGKMFAQMISQETLDPGASEIYRGLWENPRSGTFTAVGTLRARKRNVEARTDFSV